MSEIVLVHGIAQEQSSADLLESLWLPALDGARFEGGFTVDNGSNPHDASFYLGKVEVGRSIGQVFSAGGR
jgi:hypothetical protein